MIVVEATDKVQGSTPRSNWVMLCMLLNPARVRRIPDPMQTAPCASTRRGFSSPQCVRGFARFEPFRVFTVLMVSG